MATNEPPSQKAKYTTLVRRTPPEPILYSYIIYTVNQVSKYYDSTALHYTSHAFDVVCLYKLPVYFMILLQAMGAVLLE